MYMYASLNNRNTQLARIDWHVCQLKWINQAILPVGILMEDSHAIALIEWLLTYYVNVVDLSYYYLYYILQSIQRSSSEELYTRTDGRIVVLSPALFFRYSFGKTASAETLVAARVRLAS